MKLFGFEINKQNKTKLTVLNENEKAIDSLAQLQSFGIFDGDNYNPNLSLPIVKEIYTYGNGMVKFGIANLQPNELSNLFYSCPIHRSICQFKKSLIVSGGFSYENAPVSTQDKLNLYKIETAIKLPKLFKQISDDLIIHSRITIELIFDDNCKFIKANRIDPIKIRNGNKNDSGEIENYFYSNDFTVNSQVITIPSYKPGRKEKRQLFVFQHTTPGMNIYCLPAYASAANEIFTLGDLTYMRKSYLINSINPAFYLNFPRRLNQAANDELRKTLKNAKGSSNNGKTLVFQSDSKDLMPEIGTIAVSNNDKLFNTAYSQLNETICIAHSINPGILGFKVNSALGSGNELEISYSLFKNTIISDLKADVEEVINDIMFIANIPSKFVINDFDPIDYKVINGK